MKSCVAAPGDGKMVFMESKRLLSVADFPSVQQGKDFSQTLVQIPPSPHCEVCVIVPVRNEAQTLAATLTALINQVDLQGQLLDPRRYEIILLANNCSDDSAAIARSFAQEHPDIALHVVEKTLPPAQAYIGRVRQILMDEAYRRLCSLGRTRGVIASTDGDSQVSPTWIAANLYEINYGADAVGGRILVERSGRADLHPYARACYLREVGYRYLITELETYLDPDPYDRFPGHYQHYGASLAVTAEMYALAGGLPPVRTPEDVAFYRALVRVNARFHHSSLVRVVTSARQIGRTNVGLANQLNEWIEMGRQQQPFIVEPAGAIETRFVARRQLRVMWWCVLNGYQLDRKSAVSLAEMLGVSVQWLLQKLTQPYTFGQLFEQVEERQQSEQIWASRWKFVEIGQAIGDLRLRLESLRLSRSKLQINSTPDDLEPPKELYPTKSLQNRGLIPLI
ncbi:glycosyl transferase [Nostoc punctiforme NIES-2108]|uniref:4,4'-diaponeurosporenoate glycosyltransferase n=1 Tax=Nostoc punctiforme NIES-2108 TaxID=1356359 RepID=A0A367R8Z8_NOSPU|nr:glycosyl transferase [Nostoc punctiforme NIES-2108]